VKRGVEVFAVVPRRAGQGAVEDLDGMTVLGFPPAAPWSAQRLFRECDADVYHSSEPSFGTYLAQRAMPSRKHMVTFRDPRDLRDWKMEFELPSRNRLQVAHNYLYESNPLVRSAVRKADARYTSARFQIPKVRRIYRLPADPGFLPTPVAIPDDVRKALRPTVCYVARLDRRKRPGLYVELARHFPDVRFIGMGRSRDPGWESRLRRRYADVPNLEMLGFVDQFDSDLHARVLEESWILVNTANREGLPNAFLEAAAHRCAILSAVDPDGFASRFGYYAERDDFRDGLAYLLEDGRWKERGAAAQAHVRETFAIDRAMDLQLQAYRVLVEGPRKQPY
jgi:glycosyltransferase involved in cell wall biosynthesis